MLHFAFEGSRETIMEKRSRGRSISKPHLGAPTILELQAQINRLRSKVRVLRKDFDAVRATLAEDVIVLRSISREKAKQEIVDLFQTGETLYYSDLSHRLGIELPLVVEICQELEAEGEVEVDAGAV